MLLYVRVRVFPRVLGYSGASDYLGSIASDILNYNTSSHASFLLLFFSRRHPPNTTGSPGQLAQTGHFTLRSLL